MNWLWLILILPVVSSVMFVAGAALCYPHAYEDGFADGHRSYAENGPY
jgi:hypothetical protein